MQSPSPSASRPTRCHPTAPGTNRALRRIKCVCLCGAPLEKTFSSRTKRGTTEACILHATFLWVFFYGGCVEVTSAQVTLGQTRVSSPHEVSTLMSRELVQPQRKRGGASSIYRKIPTICATISIRQHDSNARPRNIDCCAGNHHQIHPHYASPNRDFTTSTSLPQSACTS
ncbi:hypothetical protein L207DRAFT_223346 [Hyaloscypha variabilis F]|uniref:Uncharacterized protein n=1 Tax=Hyaloscypha variabilis (strain UAMH 11265 / GT02V1 / F) TaxID=1149755 RepID=A0A2J6QWD5_HYAVF|nr:hypothetical protein L207DRAFT_223346 [Hyaloscypha variabilis F]